MPYITDLNALSRRRASTLTIGDLLNIRKCMRHDPNKIKKKAYYISSIL